VMTVLMATRNRAPLLSEVLTGFCRLQSPQSGWKLVVIDNGSTDETAQVLSSFAGRLPLRTAFEPRTGKNYALNFGLGLVEGDLVVFTDDDVFPHADWLIRLRDKVDAHPECSMFGGIVVPRWQVPPPPWIEWVEINPAFGTNDPRMREGLLISATEVRNIIGPNMAMRANVFASGTRFDTSIGPRGANYAMGSESELLVRLAAQGHKAYFVPNAVVEHLVREEQLHKDWILRRAIRLGRGIHRIFPVKLWGWVPRHLFRDIPKQLVYMAAAFVTLRRDQFFRARWRLNMLRGEAIEARAIARESVGKPLTTPSGSVENSVKTMEPEPRISAPRGD
jgi:glycosyltransferase involved in cell wall biosynthesis